MSRKSDVETDYGITGCGGKDDAGEHSFLWSAARLPGIVCHGIVGCAERRAENVVEALPERNCPV